MLNNLQIVSNAVTMDALKRLQAETAAELDALLPAILQSSLGFRLRYASPRQATAPSKENYEI